MTEDIKTATDKFKIFEWVDERHGYPAIVTGMNNPEEATRLRIDFTGYNFTECLQRISWKTFFNVFERSDLIFLYQDRTSNGDLSRFYKFLLIHWQGSNRIDPKTVNRIKIPT